MNISFGALIQAFFNILKKTPTAQKPQGSSFPTIFASDMPKNPYCAKLAEKMPYLVGFFSKTNHSSLF